MAKMCSANECSRPHAARGWCRTHYMRWRNHGLAAVEGAIKAMSKPKRKRRRPQCGVTGCDRPHRARGYCNRHLQRWLKYGDPTVVKYEKGAARAFMDAAFLADTDDCILWPFGTQSGDGYAGIWLDGTNRAVHVLICNAAHGPAPSEHHWVAHSCSPRLCINRRHLRWATPTEIQIGRVARGTSNRGERHPLAKLTEGRIKQIRRLRAIASRQERGDLFGVTRSAIYAVDTERTWGWLK